MNPRISRLAAIAALCSLVPCLFAGALVLCVGEDGHVAVESGCGPGAGVAGSGDACLSHTPDCACGDHCGPCVDQPVATWSGARVPAPREPIDPPVPFPCPAGLHRPEILPASVPEAGAPPFAAAAQRQRFAVVLRV